MSALSWSEELARAQLERLQGVRVEQHDDQSENAMYDLLVRGLGGDEAAEVIADIDPKVRKRMVAGHEISRRIEDPSLGAAWVVTVANQAWIKTVQRRLSSTLARFEAFGLTTVGHGDGSEEAVRLLEAAHLSHAYVDPEAATGTVAVFAGVSWVGSPLPVEELSGYVASVLTTHRDVAPKLAASGLDRTHAVIMVGIDRTAALFALDDDETDVPTSDPVVPVEISDVWLMPTWPGDRVLRWTRGVGWQQAGFMPHAL